jgi:hypothetical protein
LLDLPPGDRTHLADTSQILPRSWGLAVRELLLAARPKFTGIYVGNGLRFAEIRLEPAEKTYAHTHRTGRPCTTANQRIWLRSPRGPGRSAAAAASQPRRPAAARHALPVAQR